MDENWKFDCEIPLHDGETVPLGQPPLSRPTDQKANSVTPLLLAHEASQVALANVKVSPAESFAPIIGVMPNCALLKPLLFIQLRAPWAAETAAVYMFETACP